ncbi:MAG: RDD family protein [Tahibacter sp.]
MNDPTAVAGTTPMPNAPIWRRLAAGIYDILPLLALWFCAGAAAELLTAGTLDTHRMDHKLLLQSLLLLPTALYFVLSWMRGGQTIGMRAWRLRVVSIDAPTLSGTRATVRFLMALVSLLPAGLGIWWMLIDPQRRAWHDMVAHTRVIQIS